MKSAMRILGGIVVLFVIALVFLQGSSESSTTVTAQELSFSVSEFVTPQLSVAVRDLPTGNAQPLLDREINPLKNPHFLSEGMGLKGSNSIGLDPLAELSRTAKTGNTPDTLFTFDGLGSDGFTPPDTVGDVGPNHYIQMVNVSFAIWEKNTNPDLPPTLVQDDTLFNELFSGYGGVCESNNDGDPIVVYDELADRWLLSQFADPGGSHTMCIAISETPDPTGAYYLYDFQTPEFPDYFKFGVWEDGYYMSTNTGAPNQYYAFAFDRENMLAGQPATFQSFGGFPNFMMPSDLDGNTAPPAGSPNYFYTFFDSDYPDHPAGTDDRLALYEFDVDWDSPDNSSYTLVQEIPVAAYNYTVCGFFVGDCIPQPGTAQGIDSLSYWPMFRFAYRNQGSHEAMVGNFTVDLDGSDKAAIRWFELRKAGAGDWVLHQEGTHAPDDDHRWMGSIAMDSSGNIALGYSVSSETTFPSIRYATRLEGDPLGTLQAEMSMLEGGGSQTAVHRWGDYSAMSIDPADGCTFWYTTEYHPANDDGFNWHTAIGTFRLDSCGTADFTLSVSPPVQDVCVPNEAMFNVNIGQVQDYEDEVALTANNLPGAATAMFDPATLTPSTPSAMSMLTISNTASIAAGSYPVEIMGTALTSTHTTTIGINIFDSIPLSATLTLPADGATGAPLVPTFEWSAPAQGTDYHLEVASDIDFATVVYTATVSSTSHQMAAALNPLTTYYWRVRADNLCGEGAVSAISSFTTADIPPILLVDDDNNSPDVQSSYTDVLDALGLQYNVWDTDNSDTEPSAVDLAPYSMVIWFTGVEFGSATGPGSAGEAALADFLDSGQCLFISSQDYVYARGLTPFMQNYLGVASATSDVGQTTVTGEGVLFGGLGPYSLSYPFENYSDILTPDATAELAFSGDEGDAAVDKDSGVYRTTFFGYPFEALPVGSDQETVMQTIVDWCGTGVATGTLEGTVTDMDSGDGIEGATITADDGSNQRTTSTDENGEYSIRLAIGTYDVMATADMYTSEMSTDVVIMTDTTSTANFVLQGSSLSYSPASIYEEMEIGDVVTTTVTVTATGPLSVSFDVSIANTGAPGMELIPLSIEPVATTEATTAQSNTSFASAGGIANGIESNPAVAEGDLMLILDDGSREDSIGLTNGGQFIWLNQFTPDPAAFPFSLTEVQVLFGAGQGVNVGEIVDIYVYEDADGNPDTGADYVGGVTGVEVQATDDVSWSVYNLPTPAVLSTPGDVLIAVVNRTAGTDAGELVAAIDQTASQGRSWIGFYSAGDPADPPVLPADTDWGVIDGFGLAGNWMVRGMGQAGTVGAWASAVPDNGSAPANGTTTFDVVFDARSLYEVGQYTAELSFNGSFVNDVETMPLTMNLTCPSCGFLDGSITDLETDDALNAQIHITSSNGFDVMLSGESYDIAVQPGDYNITVSANGYFDESAKVTVSAEETVTTDFEITPMIAMLEYMPAEIEEDMEIGDIVTTMVTVQNTGYIDLEFSVNIDGYDGPGVQVVPHSSSLPANGKVKQSRSNDGNSSGLTNWASADPDNGVVAAGETMTFDVSFDATALYQEGDYTANLSFSGNFVNDVEAMPLTMHITCPTCGLLEGSITDAFTADPLSANINVMGDGVEINVNGDSYSLAVPAGDYDITVSANDYFDESASVSAVMGETSVTDFMLTPIVALLDYMPDSFEQTIAMGQMASQQLMIENDGTIAFDFGLSDVEIGTPEATIAAPMITCPEDEFGYSCTDSNEPGGPTYNFEEISATGTAIVLGDDQVSDPIPLGFMFNFYEEDYSDIYVSSNGFLTVLDGQGSGCCSGPSMPTAGDPDGVIAGWWDDLNPSAGGTIHYETVGTAPNRHLIVQFTEIPHCCGTSDLVTMQYKLFEGSNMIEVHYEAAPSDGSTHSAGIENQDGTSGVQYHNSGEALVTPLAVRYQTYQDAAWLEQAPMTGTVEADDSMMIDIIFNATEITQTGTYTAVMSINGTFDNPEEVLPIEVVMHVEDPAPEMEIDLEVPEMMIEPGDEMSQTLTLSNTGNVALDWEAYTEEGAARLVVGGECSGNNIEAGWLMLDSTSGSVPAGETDDIEVMVDSTGLEAGDHDANVCITLPAHEQMMTIPVTLTVVPTTAVDMAELNVSESSDTLPLGLLAAGMLLLVAGGVVVKRQRES